MFSVEKINIQQFKLVYVLNSSIKLFTLDIKQFKQINNSYISDGKKNRLNSKVSL